MENIRKIIREELSKLFNATPEDKKVVIEILEAFVSNKVNIKSVEVTGGASDPYDVQVSKMGQSDSTKGEFDISLEYNNWDIAIIGNVTIYATATSSYQSATQLNPESQPELSFEVDINITNIYCYPLNNNPYPNNIELSDMLLDNVINNLPGGLFEQTINKIKQLVSDKVSI